MKMNMIHDVIVIGSGPAGLATAIEAQKAGLNYVVLDKGAIANAIQGFQRDMFFFSTPELLEIGGIPFIVPTTRPTSLDCVNYYRRVVDHFKLNCRFYQEVTTVRKEGDTFTVSIADGTTYNAKKVVVATGYYYTPTPLDVPGEDLPHVTHYYRDPLPYYKQNVLIVGGKNSAVEAALDLYRHGANVTVVHRGPELSKNVKYWILPDFLNRCAEGSIKFLGNTTVKEFRSGITVVESAEEGKSRVSEIPTDFAFILIGYRPDVPFMERLGIQLDPESLAPVINPDTYETNIPSLYVAGGVVPGKYNNKVFIENGRTHGMSIVKSILGRQAKGS